MPIRVECSRCHDVTHFADNDAGLAVACLACGQHLRVPHPPKKPPAAIGPIVLPDEPPPLFANVKHDPDAGAAVRHAEVNPRPVRRPTRTKSAWRNCVLLLTLLGATGIAIVAYRNRDRRSTPSPSEQAAVSVTQPAPVSIARATTKAAAAPATNAAPRVTAPSPALASARTEPVTAAVSTGRAYTPANAPVGFVGLERLEYMGDRLVADSYDASAGTYGGDNARAAARLVSNGEIVLAGAGEIRGAVHPGPGIALKPAKRVAVTGSTSPLQARVAAPPVRLDPFAQDSANASLPEKFFRGGNLTVYGKHTVAMPAGVYYLNDVTIDPAATLHCDGPVTLLVSGQLMIAGAIETAGDRPSNCRIRCTGARDVIIACRGSLYIDLYAPTCNVNLGGGKTEVYGSIVARRLRVAGGALHLDESLW